MAILIAAGATFLIARRLEPPVASPNTVPIVAAARELAVGVPLTAADLVTIGWPDNVPLAVSFSRIEDVVGRLLILSVSSRQPLLARDLAAPGSGFDLAGKIPPGMRATAVSSNEVVGVAGFLFPGSHVDVVATFTLPAG